MCAICQDVVYRCHPDQALLGSLLSCKSGCQTHWECYFDLCNNASTTSFDKTTGLLKYHVCQQMCVFAYITSNHRRLRNTEFLNFTSQFTHLELGSLGHGWTCPRIGRSKGCRILPPDGPHTVYGAWVFLLWPGVSSRCLHLYTLSIATLFHCLKVTSFVIGYTRLVSKFSSCEITQISSRNVH